MRKMRKLGIVIEAHQDRLGSLVLEPRSQYWRKRFERALALYADIGAPDDCRVYAHMTDGLKWDWIPRRYWTDLDNGWTVAFLLDPWVYASFLGWDCRENY